MKRVLKLRRSVVRNLDDRRLGGIVGGGTGTGLSLEIRLCLASFPCPTQTTAMSCGGGCQQ
jgi:hypothetical protein